MQPVFFTSWALWAKMSFVLALTILSVFGIAYAKLLWVNRLVRKQEGKDEERRIKIEDSRRISPMADPRKSQDIPFGVRAIQSGIQVDGIWISKGSTSIPTSLNLGHVRKSTSDCTGDHNTSPEPSLYSSRAAVYSGSSRGRTPRREGDLTTPIADQRGITEIQDARGHFLSYKPRRSSHLRYDSQGDAKFNEETLDQLEGKPTTVTETPSPMIIRTTEMENDTSSGAVADNERSSGSETDATLSSITKPRVHDLRQSSPGQALGGSSMFGIVKVASARPLRVSLPIPSSKIEYVPLPFKPSEHDLFDPAPILNPDPIRDTFPFKPPYAQTTRELTASGESQVPLLSHSRSQSPFIAGELHMNRSVRKINSGFEILPAGTFGISSESKHELMGQDDQAVDKRQSNKLQKKTRTSTSSRRLSGTFESLEAA